MPKKIKRRNFVAQSLLLRKGGVHEKSRSAKRQQAKRQLRKTINESVIARKKGDYSSQLIIA